MELYVHIPFCAKKCRYCDFASFVSSNEQMQEYVDLLLKEAEFCCSAYGHPEIDTVYIGGGTPSLLPAGLTEHLLSGLFKCFHINNNAEISIEANPGTVSGEWLNVCKQNGVNRFSLGMQAAQNSLLKILGRIHNFDDVKKTVSLLRSNDIRNYNLDLMFGLPGQSAEDWKETVNAALCLEPAHISCYGLIPEENTPMKADLDSGVLSLPEPETERRMYYDAREFLHCNGFRQYEISNFARPGYECRHNIGYWKQVPYIGLGLSAASMVNPVHTHGFEYDRYTNPSDFQNYKTEVCLNHNRLRSAEHISSEESRFETVMLGLRMNEGIQENEFIRLHGCTMESIWLDTLKKMVERKLMVKENGSWKLTELGMDLQNTVLIEFMPD